MSKEEKKKEAKAQKKNFFIKMAEIVGNKSVGSCGIWFNQPAVPDKMKK